MLRLQVSNMRCEGCVRKIKEEISEYDLHVKLTADVAKGFIDVESNLESEVLMIILKMAGYDTNVVTKVTDRTS